MRRDVGWTSSPECCGGCICERDRRMRSSILPCASPGASSIGSRGPLNRMIANTVRHAHRTSTIPAVAYMHLKGKTKSQRIDETIYSTKLSPICRRVHPDLGRARATVTADGLQGRSRPTGRRAFAEICGEGCGCDGKRAIPDASVRDRSSRPFDEAEGQLRGRLSHSHFGN